MDIHRRAEYIVQSIVVAIKYIKIIPIFCALLIAGDVFALTVSPNPAVYSQEPVCTSSNPILIYASVGGSYNPAGTTPFSCGNGDLFGDLTFEGYSEAPQILYFLEITAEDQGNSMCFGADQPMTLCQPYAVGDIAQVYLNGYGQSSNNLTGNLTLTGLIGSISATSADMFSSGLPIISIIIGIGLGLGFLSWAIYQFRKKR